MLRLRKFVILFIFCFFCFLQEFFEKNCQFFNLVCSLTTFLARLMKYFQIQQILPFLGPKRGIFDVTTWRILDFIYFLLFSLVQEFERQNTVSMYYVCMYVCTENILSMYIVYVHGINTVFLSKVLANRQKLRLKVTGCSVTSMPLCLWFTG